MIQEGMLTVIRNAEVREGRMGKTIYIKNEFKKHIDLDQWPYTPPGTEEVLYRDRHLHRATLC